MGSNKAINGTMLGKKLVYSSSVTLRFPWSVAGGVGGNKVFEPKSRQCVGAGGDNMLVNT